MIWLCCLNVNKLHFERCFLGDVADLVQYLATALGADDLSLNEIAFAEDPLAILAAVDLGHYFLTSAFAFSASAAAAAFS